MVDPAGTRDDPVKGRVMRTMKWNRLAMVCVVGLAAASCGGGDSSGTPEPTDSVVVVETDAVSTTTLPTATAEVTPTSTTETVAEDDPGNESVASGELPMGKLVFQSDRSGNLDIFSLNAATGSVEQITDSPDRDRVPSWSPDGSSVIYQFSNGFGESPTGLAPTTIMVIDADGGGSPARLFGGHSKSSASFLPDGTGIVFDSDASGTFQIYLAAVDGSSPEQITDDPVQASGAAVSPDGSRLLFSSLRDGNRELYTMALDGTGLTRLTDDPGDDGAGAWSPDGERIAFDSERSGDRDVWIMNADGSDPVQVTDDPSRDGFPTWSPDGEWIAFDTDRDGNHEIYAVSVSTGDIVNVTNDPANDSFPSWGN